MVKRRLILLGKIETSVVFPLKRWALCSRRLLSAVVRNLLKRLIHRAILGFKQRPIVPLWNPKRGCLFGHCSIKNAQLNRMLAVHFAGAHHWCESGKCPEIGLSPRSLPPFHEASFLQPSMGAAHVLLRFLLRASFSLFFDSLIRSL